MPAAQRETACVTQAARQLAQRRRRMAMPGSSWDRFTRFMKRALPVAAGLVLLVLLVLPLAEDREFSFILSKDRVDMAGDRMRVENAVYRGEDDEGRPFRVSAARGLQTSSADPRVALSDLTARLQMAEGVATVTAPRGLYNMESERVRVSGPVLVERPDGYRMTTADVVVDLKTRRVYGDGRISGAVPLGRFSADELAADIDERRLVLEGNTKLRITQR